MRAQRQKSRNLHLMCGVSVPPPVRVRVRPPDRLQSAVRGGREGGSKTGCRSKVNRAKNERRTRTRRRRPENEDCVAETATGPRHRNAGNKSVRLKIALTQKFLCYFWKSTEERKTERSGQDSSPSVVGPSGRPSVLRPSLAAAVCLKLN